MNEHIKELIIEAGFPQFGKMYVVTDGEELKQFAELIVRECATIADKWVDDTDNGQNYPSEIIKQHFGFDK